MYADRDWTKISNNLKICWISWPNFNIKEKNENNAFEYIVWFSKVFSKEEIKLIENPGNNLNDCQSEEKWLKYIINYESMTFWYELS